MRTITEQTAQSSMPKQKNNNLQTFSTTLADGRVITIREMTGRDLVFMEEKLSKEGDVSKGMRIIERLIVGEEKITYEDILDLGVRDFKKLSDLVGKANGDEEGEDPN